MLYTVKCRSFEKFFIYLYKLKGKSIMKKFLSAVLAASMVLAAAPTVYAEDSIPMIDPLGNVYVLGEDNILTLSNEHEIHHGENFYVMLVDQGTGMPTDVRRDDADDMRIYADWEEGESRVTDDDIVYKKAKDVEVESTIPPTFSVNVTLNVASTAVVVNGVTKADGTGWTQEEITEATDPEILEQAVAKYINENQAAFEKLALESTYDLIIDPILYNGNVYKDEAEFLAQNSSVRRVTGGYMYPATGTPVLYFDSTADKDAHFNTTGGYIAANNTDKILFKLRDTYYTSRTAAEEALVDILLAENTVSQITNTTTGRVLDGVFHPGYTEAPQKGHFYDSVNNEISFVREESEVGPTNIASVDVFTFDELVHATKIYAENDYINSADSTKIIVDGSGTIPSAPLNVLVDNPAVTSGFFVRYNDTQSGGLGIYYGYYTDANALDIASEYTYVAAGNNTNIYSSISGSYIVGTGTHSTPILNSYYSNGETKTYYLNDDALVATYENGNNLITTEATGYYKLSADSSTVTEYITSFDSMYANASIFYTDVLEAEAQIPANRVIDISANNDDTWRVKGGFAQVSPTDLANTISATENAITRIGISTGTQLPSAFVTGLATLTGEDYYYFAEFETRTYMGENEYDVVGFVSVGRSRSDAEDRGTTSVFMTLTAGEYEDGEPQGGDIHIEGEYDAVVEFEEDIGEVYITWGRDAMFVVDIGNQNDLNLGYNTDWDDDLADRHGYANIDFLNFVAQPRFNRSGDFYIYADEDAFIYEVDEDGYIEHIDKAEWDSEEEAWTFRTNTLASYLITDEELVITEKDGTILEPETDDVETATPTVGKPNPGTGR